MEKEKLDAKLNQEPQIPGLPRCIAYLATVILVTVFLFFISEYVYLRYYTTEGAASILRLIGINSEVTFNPGAFIGAEVKIGGMDPFYSFYVVKICSGIEAIALLIGLILATPTSWKRKVIGTLFITFGIFFANILRIVTTIVLATQDYSEFIYHEVVSAIFTVIFIIVFILMIQAWIIPNFIDSLINVMVGIVRAIKRM